jgi:hypothetical protein
VSKDLSCPLDAQQSDLQMSLRFFAEERISLWLPMKTDDCSIQARRKKGIAGQQRRFTSLWFDVKIYPSLVSLLSFVTLAQKFLLDETEAARKVHDHDGLTVKTLFSSCSETGRVRTQFSTRILVVRNE